MGHFAVGGADGDGEFGVAGIGDAEVAVAGLDLAGGGDEGE